LFYSNLCFIWQFQPGGREGPFALSKAMKSFLNTWLNVVVSCLIKNQREIFTWEGGGGGLLLEGGYLSFALSVGSPAAPVGPRYLLSANLLFWRSLTIMSQAVGDL